MSRATPSVADQTLTWELVDEERFAGPVPPRPWVEDTYEQVTDPFDEGGAYWGYRVNGPPASWEGAWMPPATARRETGTATFRSFRRHVPYGRDGWLAFESYARTGASGRLARHRGGSFEPATVDGNSTLRIRAPRHVDAALVRPALPLPRFYRVELEVGAIRCSLAELKGDEDGGPWSGLAGGNGLYLLAILDAIPLPHNNTWIHPRKVVSIDSFVTPALLAAHGHQQPVTLQYMGLRDYEREDAGKGPNDFAYYLHCFDPTSGTWVPRNVPAAGLRDDAWYTVGIERNVQGFVLSLRGRFAGASEVRELRASIAFDEGLVWHYDRPGDPAPRFPTNPGTWPPGGSPHYFTFGLPHINWYRGEAVFRNLRVYRGLPRV